MKTTNITTLLILTLIFLAAGCSDPISPTGKEKPGSGPEAFGLVEITISGIGTQAMSASAKPATPHTAYSLTAPTGSSGPNDGTIQLEALATGSYTAGERGSGGVRYVYATFKVRNANVDGNPYPNIRQNLTFLAVDNSQTHGVSAVSELKLYDTGLITGADAITFAEATIPTGRVGIKAGGPFIPVQADVLQVLTPAEVAALSPPAGVDVFPYGFVTRSPNTTPGSRDLPANPGSTQFDGLVTFTFKLPLQSQANQDPFGITFLVLPVDDSQTRLTLPIEFNQFGYEAFAEVFAGLNAEYVTIFPHSSYRGVIRLLCGPVRVSGTTVSPVETLFEPPTTLVSLAPDPYATTSNNLPLTTDFDATFTGNVRGANAFGSQNIAGFVIHARQTGTKFIGQIFTGGNTPTLSSPNGIYSANEIIEVSLTGQLGSCPAEVVRYRVGPTGGTGSFNGPTKFNVENTPVSTALGDINGDGNMDIVVANSDSDNITILEGDGTGSFSQYFDSPITVDTNPNTVKLGDLNNDGNLDIVVADNILSNDVSVLLAGPSGGFGSPKSFDAGGFGPSGLALGDVNGDGALDIVTANSANDNVGVLIGDSDGGFVLSGTFTVGDYPESVTLGDVNKDGFLDIVTADYGSPPSGTTVSLLPGLGNGEFGAATPFTVGTAPVDVALGDLDNDGNLDIATANANSNDVSVLLGDGLGGFAAATPFGPVNNSRSIALGDLNNDGFLDIVTANGSSPNNLSELLNDGSGGFFVSSSSTGETANDASIGDINNDGSLDVVIAENGITSTDQVAVLEGQ